MFNLTNEFFFCRGGGGFAVFYVPSFLIPQNSVSVEGRVLNPRVTRTG